MLDSILRIVKMLLRFFLSPVARCAVVTLGMWLYLRNKYVLDAGEQYLHYFT